MGVDITVRIVDWTHLMGIPPRDRLEVLQASAYTDDDSDTDAGWVWPTEPDRSWLGRYEFDGTLGSYKPHFWAAEAWDDVRGAASSVPPASLYWCGLAQAGSLMTDHRRGTASSVGERTFFESRWSGPSTYSRGAETEGPHRGVREGSVQVPP